MAKKQDIQADNVIKLPVKGGRPPINFTPDIIEFILSEIIAGKSVQYIATSGKIEMGDDFPSAAVIYKQLAMNDVFQESYTRAREMQQDTYAEEIVAIADGDHPDFVSATPEDRKMAIEARKWVMGKLRPKKYNDQVMRMEITGKDGTPLVPTQEIDVSSLTDEARDSLRFALTAIEAREGETEDLNIDGDDDDE